MVYHARRRSGCGGTSIENAVLQSDTNQVGYDWLDIKTLNTLPLYPSKLRRQIMNLYEGKEHKVYLGNEEIGDPEVTY